MKITALAALVMVAGAGAAESKNLILNNAREAVQVCHDNAADGVANLRARNIATQMFAGIGVATEWHPADSSPDGALRISYSTTTPKKLMPGALAYAMPCEGTHIVIFYDRVEAAMIEPQRVTVLLAHVIAHEVTHVLEGTPRHSAEGVLKAHWTEGDYSSMCFKPLKFADEDVVLIHRGLERRATLRNSELSVAK